LTEMDFLTVSVKMAQTFEATTIRGKRGTFITLAILSNDKKTFSMRRQPVGQREFKELGTVFTTLHFLRNLD
jgi:hypothetical protein